jgi:hypothetical protein
LGANETTKTNCGCRNVLWLLQIEPNDTRCSNNCIGIKEHPKVHANFWPNNISTFWSDLKSWIMVRSAKSVSRAVFLNEWGDVAPKGTFSTFFGYFARPIWGIGAPVKPRTFQNWCWGRPPDFRLVDIRQA